MNKMEFLEYAIGLTEKEREEEAKVCSLNGRYDRLRGIDQGLFIAKIITEINWTEDALLNFIRNAIENF